MCQRPKQTTMTGCLRSCVTIHMGSTKSVSLEITAAAYGVIS